MATRPLRNCKQPCEVCRAAANTTPRAAHAEQSCMARAHHSPAIRTLTAHTTKGHTDTHYAQHTRTTTHTCARARAPCTANAHTTTLQHTHTMHPTCLHTNGEDAPTNQLHVRTAHQPTSTQPQEHASRMPTHTGDHDKPCSGECLTQQRKRERAPPLWRLAVTVAHHFAHINTRGDCTHTNIARLTALRQACGRQAPHSARHPACTPARSTWRTTLLHHTAHHDTHTHTHTDLRFIKQWVVDIPRIRSSRRGTRASSRKRMCLLCANARHSSWHGNTPDSTPRRKTHTGAASGTASHDEQSMCVCTHTLRHMPAHQVRKHCLGARGRNGHDRTRAGNITNPKTRAHHERDHAQVETQRHAPAKRHMLVS